MDYNNHSSNSPTNMIKDPEKRQGGGGSISIETVVNIIQQCDLYELLALKRILADTQTLNSGGPKQNLEIKKIGTKYYFYLTWTDPKTKKKVSEYVSNSLSERLKELIIKNCS
jgi:hypothetical protein